MALNRNRIEGFDLARALAVMGMVVVNFAAMMGIVVYPIQWIIKNNGAPDAGLVLDSAGFFCCAGILTASLWLRWFRRGPWRHCLIVWPGAARRLGSAIVHALGQTIYRYDHR